tara:strand:+ start:201 stop:395 length:195 start_codon:yes stop_codon:yes gene_type:complete
MYFERNRNIAFLNLKSRKKYDREIFFGENFFTNFVLGRIFHINYLWWVSSNNSRLNLQEKNEVL